MALKHEEHLHGDARAQKAGGGEALCIQRVSEDCSLGREDHGILVCHRIVEKIATAQLELISRSWEIVTELRPYRKTILV